MRKFKHYGKDGTPVKCPQCKGKSFTDHIKSIDGGVISETQIDCKRCYSTVAYWAYGSYDPAYYKINNFVDFLEYTLLGEVLIKR